MREVIALFEPRQLGPGRLERLFDRAQSRAERIECCLGPGTMLDRAHVAADKMEAGAEDNWLEDNRCDHDRMHDVPRESTSSEHRALAQHSDGCIRHPYHLGNADGATRLETQPGRVAIAPLLSSRFAPTGRWNDASLAPPHARPGAGA